MDYLIPATIIVIGDLFSGHPGSKRWELIIALFGLTGLVSIMLLVLPFTRTSSAIPSWVHEGLLSTAGYCLLPAVTRDWERIFKLAFRRSLGDENGPAS